MRTDTQTRINVRNPYALARRTLLDLMVGAALFIGLAGLLMFEQGGLAQAAPFGTSADGGGPGVDFFVLSAMFSVLYAFNAAMIRHMARRFVLRARRRP